MLKIAFVSNNYTPFQGGVVSSIQAFCKTLPSHGVEPRLYTLNFGTVESDAPFVTRLFCPIQFNYRNNNMAVPLMAQVQLLQEFTEFKPDIIHVQHPFLLGKAAILIAKKLGIPTVFTYHTQYDQYVHYAPFPHKFSKHVVARRVTNFCNSVDHIIAPSESIKQIIQPQTYTPISALSSPLQDIFLHESQPIKKLAQPYRLLCVSRFTQEKQLPLLIDALAQLPAGYAQLELIGYGYLENELRSYVNNKLGIRSNEVTFTIRPDKSYIRHAYQNAHLFVFSSVSETQGLVIAESMAAGTPVVAYAGPGINDIVQHGVNGYLVCNTDQMAVAIKEACENQENYASLCHEAFKTAQYYTPDACASKLKALYEQLISF